MPKNLMPLAAFSYFIIDLSPSIHQRHEWMADFMSSLSSFLSGVSVYFLASSTSPHYQYRSISQEAEKGEKLIKYRTLLQYLCAPASERARNK